MRIARIFILGIVLTAALAGSAVAGKDQVRFVGIHPIPKVHGGGLCHIEGPHVHVYVPTDIKASYRVQGGAYYFVGDPQPYGWEGERFEYTGHHPIHVVSHAVEVEPVEPVYCYLDGPHYHGYAPDPVIVGDFDVHGDAYVFVGVVPPAPVVVVKPAVVVRPRPTRGVVIQVIVDDHHHHYKWKHKHKHKHHHDDDWDDD